MAQLNCFPQEYGAQSVESSDYVSLAGSAQQCSSYATQLAESSYSQQNLASGNNDTYNEDRPALPPKPFPGPPIYREPPNPPSHDHPDVCLNASSPSRPTESYTHISHSERPERIDRPASRTHAWVQEHKTSGKLVGEKWSSLQRKLKSFLSQSASSKELTDFEKRQSIEESQEIDDTERSRPISSQFNMNTPAAEQHLNYISASSFSGNSVALSLPPSAGHTHHCKPYQTERHPFAAPTNVSEHEQDEIADPDQLRDTCNKFFAREQRISWSNYLTPRNCYSNNIKSSYDYDKLVPKEVIGRPSQEKKPDLAPNADSVYGDLAPLPSFSRLRDSSSQPPELPARTADGSYYAKRVQNFSEETAQDMSSEVKVPNKENEAASDTLTPNSTECVDGTEVYKSSSESGRGTMHSSMHGSKSVVSPHSSGVSAASNLDTSLDSDHSANGTIWNRQCREFSGNRFSGDMQETQGRHIYETPNTIKSRQINEKDEQNDQSSESLSDNPMLPSTSFVPSPTNSAENSPKPSARSTFKLSMSASALNGCSRSSDHLQKVNEIIPKTTSKKTSMRRTTSSNQVSCKHRNGKMSQFSKSSTSMNHRLGISHGTNSPRKCNSSPPSRHLSRSQLGYPCFMDNGDLDLTSTTTGLDVESLLDEDDYSSDLSATASTMEPNEVSMIRKQLEGLETMYSEILRLLGVKNSCKSNSFASSLDPSRHSRRKLNGSLSSLTGHSSVSRGNHSFVDKRGQSEKRRTRDCKSSSANKRLQRLESHVVTLARSVAHLSSEMRTQHILVQELENMRQDVTWVQERLRLMQLAQGCHSSNGGRNTSMPMPRDWDNFHKEAIELLNPSRANKLTKFFGDEPPLIRQFLKRLGYEKYAANFESEKIGIKELPYLTEDRLQKMGIPMGPRIRILQEAISCYPHNQYKVYIV